MRLHTLKDKLFVDRPLEDVFAFFERPENLARITPPRMAMTTLTPSPIAMCAGAVFDYTVRVRGVSLHWRSAIADYDPPHRFVDVQLKGPYAFWHHAHEFAAEDGGTRISDTVTYALPFGPLGDIVHALFVRQDIQSIFSYRAAQIASLLGEHKPSAAP